MMSLHMGFSSSGPFNREDVEMEFRNQHHTNLPIRAHPIQFEA
jgi:hypothetical protein